MQANTLSSMPGVPPAPVDMIMPEPLQTIVIWFGVILVVAFSAWATKRLITARDMFPFSMMIGGALAFFSIEPFYDVLGFVYHPEIDQVAAFNSMGRDYPLHLLILYTFYWGLLAVYFDKVFEKGVTTRWVWIAFIIWTPAQIIFETPLLLQGLWVYYGDQPLRIGLYPLWVAPATAGAAILSFSLIYYLRKKILKPSYTPLLGLVLASSLAAGTLATCWPMFLGLNVDRSHSLSGLILTVPATILTTIISAGCVWLALEILKLAGSVKSVDARAD